VGGGEPMGVGWGRWVLHGFGRGQVPQVALWWNPVMCVAKMADGKQTPQNALMHLIPVKRLFITSDATA
jgi:hypothetical protein